MMSGFQLTEAKQKLIKFIQQRSEQYEAYARQEAIALARDPNSKQLQASAGRIVAINDALHEMAKDVIEQVHANWPTQS